MVYIIDKDLSVMTVKTDSGATLFRKYSRISFHALYTCFIPPRTYARACSLYLGPMEMIYYSVHKFSRCYLLLLTIKDNLVFSIMFTVSSY